MIDFWNFKDAFVVAQANLLWLALALALGLVVGWMTSTPQDSANEGNS